MEHFEMKKVVKMQQEEIPDISALELANDYRLLEWCILMPLSQERSLTVCWGCCSLNTGVRFASRKSISLGAFTHE